MEWDPGLSPSEPVLWTWAPSPMANGRIGHMAIMQAICQVQGQEIQTLCLRIITLPAKYFLCCPGHGSQADKASASGAFENLSLKWAAALLHFLGLMEEHLRVILGFSQTKRGRRPLRDSEGNLGTCSFQGEFDCPEIANHSL